ncbi:MAG TPA: FmdB family zinc ribbon protein [Bryobacteraceae bacterium]|nr:FmdB family zinc ribbon protein [Bryobacteraceae bacterium]
MPLYEYKCHGCGDVFEFRQKFSDEPIKTHEACGGTVERLISAPALQFKGTGWYVTDYAKGNSAGPKPVAGNSESGKKESGGKESTGSGSSGNSESGSKASTTDSSPSASGSGDKK